MDKRGSNDIKHIRTCLKNNILHNKTVADHDKEWKQILNLLERTIRFGESNSALIIGPRGCGKTKVSQLMMILC